MSYETLREGDTSPAAEQASQLLYDLGYYQDYPDPHYGTYHVQAVAAFQADQGLAADGVLGPRTWEALLNASGGGGGQQDVGVGDTAPAEEYPTLRDGDHHPAAEVASRWLRELGYYEDYPDPYYGSYHAEAVRLFQEAQGMTADGILGPNTWEVLRSAAGQ